MQEEETDEADAVPTDQPQEDESNSIDDEGNDAASDAADAAAEDLEAADAVAADLDAADAADLAADSEETEERPPADTMEEEADEDTEAPDREEEDEAQMAPVRKVAPAKMRPTARPTAAAAAAKEDEEEGFPANQARQVIPATKSRQVIPAKRQPSAAAAEEDEIEDEDSAIDETYTPQTLLEELDLARIKKPKTALRPNTIVTAYSRHDGDDTEDVTNDIERR
mmetsp:Transcript_42005/g.67490  ORF Transcript_42005/g.67490 Transcript_42005/m.67490 type:complete len:225 (+) Transcript_42005:178-852(+)